MLEQINIEKDMRLKLYGFVPCCKVPKKEQVFSKDPQHFVSHRLPHKVRSIGRVDAGPTVGLLLGTLLWCFLVLGTVPWCLVRSIHIFQKPHTYVKCMCPSNRFRMPTFHLSFQVEAAQDAPECEPCCRVRYYGLDTTICNSLLIGVCCLFQHVTQITSRNSPFLDCAGTGSPGRADACPVVIGPLRPSGHMLHAAPSRMGLRNSGTNS